MHHIYSKHGTYMFAIYIHLYDVTIIYGGTQWLSLLRHCATKRKVAGSIPDGLTRILPRHNPSDCTTALGSTQVSNRNEYWEYFPRG